MDEGIQTSTPLIYDKFIPPPPRKLWSADSPMEQLYRNKWVKYRNSIDEKDPWSALDSPHYVDFKDLPEVPDDYFDGVNEHKISTPLSFKNQQRLPGRDIENNNLLEDLRRCTLSAIKPVYDHEGQDESDSSSEINDTVKLFSNFPREIVSSSKPLKEAVFTEEKNGEEAKTELCPKFDQTSKNEEKKNATEKKKCTIVEPFSFENREKHRQEHVQARRERDSAGREILKGFRATPLPNFLKNRGKVIGKANSCLKPKTAENTNDIRKMHSAVETWKKKAFQPVHQKRAPIVCKPPNLLTAARALERQRFEEEMKKKEKEREELRKRQETARKKRDEEEIAKLRQNLVHKPQPIRKYKLIVPKVTKRQMNDPIIPPISKRPRNH